MHPSQTLQNLIIVPGHSLLKDHIVAGESLEYYQNPDNWLLEDYQVGDLPFYLEHIQAGLQALEKDPHAILVFSGGRTRQGGKMWSEAESYLLAAKSMPAWKRAFEARVITEDYARDSMQNIHHSLMRYFIHLNRFPQKIDVFNWGFKSERFHFHAATLGIPSDSFTYHSVNNLKDETLRLVQKFEKKVFEQFQQDPFSLHGELMQKKIQRDRHNEGNPYQPLLSYFPYETDLKKLEQSIASLPKKENKTPFIEHPSLMRFDWSPVYHRRLA